MRSMFLYRRFIAVLLFAAVFAGGLVIPVSPAISAGLSVSPEELLGISTQTIEGELQEALQSSSGLKGARALKHPKDITAFYASRDFKPYWVDNAGAQQNARNFLSIIGKSWTHGLNPYQYHQEEIRSLINEEQKAPLADLEILLTDAYVRMAQDLTGIRVNPAKLKTSSRYWRQPYKADYLLSLLSKKKQIKALISSLEPQGQTYKTLQKELEAAIGGAPESYEEILPIRVENILRPYERHERVPDLRLRLNIPLNGQYPYMYDDNLAAAVIKFQRENSLKPDGIIGEQTLEILNKTRQQKIYQLIANLERLRWVEENRPDKFIVVNIPSATLWAVEDNKVSFEMPVIVGRPKRPTNIFITEVDGMRFNPTWTVPPTIKKEDILPKLREDPEYLAQKGMELVMGRGTKAMTIDPTAVDWNGITPDELKYFTMTQIPGQNNPLGRLRVLMPNQYNIYLHDTNQPEYFERSSRAASSGCIRLKDPEKVAEFIMSARKNWSEEEMQAILDQGEMRDIYVSRPIPIYLLYYTVWMNENGGLVYGPDLYEHDENLIKMLLDIDGILISVDNTESMKAPASFVLN